MPDQEQWGEYQDMMDEVRVMEAHAKKVKSPLREEWERQAWNARVMAEYRLNQK